MAALPDPRDVQVATAYPAVNAYRAALAGLRTQRAAVTRAAGYRDYVLEHYITTTKSGREGRARAMESYEQAVRDLADLEAQLPALAAAAERECPEAAARVGLSADAYAANVAAEHEWYADRH